LTTAWNQLKFEAFVRSTSLYVLPKDVTTSYKRKVYASDTTRPNTTSVPQKKAVTNILLRMECVFNTIIRKGYNASNLDVLNGLKLEGFVYHMEELFQNVKMKLVSRMLSLEAIAWFMEEQFLNVRKQDVTTIL
jgi:hypothetical protein